MGPIPEVHFNLSDDPDTTTTEEPAAEGAPPVQRKSTAVSAPRTARTEATTTSPARALVERVGNEAGEDTQKRRAKPRPVPLVGKIDELSSPARHTLVVAASFNDSDSVKMVPVGNHC